MRRLTMMILAVLVVLSSFSIVGAETKGTFSDVKDTHWAKAQIDLAVERGYVSGYPDNTFQPNKEVTRAEFIKMVVDALKLPHSQGGSPWYQPYVSAAFEMELLDKTDSTEYKKPISRLEIMRIVSRGLAREEQFKAYFDAFDGLYNGDLPFTDYREFQEKDLPYIGLSFGAGVVNGYPDETMGLKKTATRAEAVVMIENLLAVRTKDPSIKIRLQELKEVAETGMNLTTLSTLIPDMNLQTEKALIEHKNFSGKIKRLYVVPFEDERISVYEDKFIGGREELEQFNDVYTTDIRGFIVAVMDVTIKADGNDDYYTKHPNLMGSGGSLFFYQEPRKKFGYEIQFLDEQIKHKKGDKLELVLYLGYTNENKFGYLQTNNAVSGSYYRLYTNPEAK